MSHDADYYFALEMQKRWNDQDGDGDVEEVGFKAPKPKKPPAISKAKSGLQEVALPFNTNRSKYRSNMDDDFLNRTQNLVHPQWETLDPTPDIHALFNNFDAKFFQGRLKCVTLEWSKRMYSCAGICYSKCNRYGKDVTIRLSQPLLTLRPRKDLVETMLHEMIHAYCFVLNIREGNGGHGPNFKKIMYGINTVAGTNITVYHTFHDEVEVYKQHWWRCNGLCQHRAPFMGYVKRTSNRAPGPNDQWWAAHQESCGGTFMKIKEPEKKKKQKAIKTQGKENNKISSNATDLRKFFTPATSTSGANTSNISGFGNISKGSAGFKGPTKVNGGGTMLLNPKTKQPATQNIAQPAPKSSLTGIAAAFPPSSYPGLSTDPFNTNALPKSKSGFATPGGNLRNVRGFRDLGDSNSDGEGNSGRAVSGFKTNNANDFISGNGYALDSNNSLIMSHPKTNSDQIDRNHLRDVWSKRFGSNQQTSSGDNKRRRLSADFSSIYIADEAMPKKHPANDWLVVDEDVMLQEKPNEVIALSSDDDDSDDSSSTPGPTQVRRYKTADERQNAIKQEIMDDSIDLNDDDIVLIDDEYDDNFSAATEMADTSIIDEFFGEDTLLKEFKRENDVVPSGSRHLPNPDDDIITCPVCLDKMKRCLFGEHMNGCTGIAIKVVPKFPTLKKLAGTSREIKPQRKQKISKSVAQQVLLDAGYTEQDILNISNLANSEEECSFSSSFSNANEGSEQSSIAQNTQECPVCSRQIEESKMNDHLDECLLP